jgi:hypothetical protein
VKKKKYFRQGFCYDAFIPVQRLETDYETRIIPRTLGFKTDLAYEENAITTPHRLFGFVKRSESRVTRKHSRSTRWIDQGAIPGYFLILKFSIKYFRNEVALKDHYATKPIGAKC